MHRTTRVWMSAVLTLALTAGAFAQGVYYESESKGGPLGKDGRASKTYAMPKMFKHVDETDGVIVIARLDRERFYFVSTKEKSYWELTFAEMEARAKKSTAKLDAEMAKMQDEMKNMPPEQKKMMEQMLGGQMGALANKESKVEVIRAGESKRISKYPCTKYVATSGGKELLTVWTTNDVKGFDALRKDWDQFSKRMMLMNPGGAKLAEAMAKVEGFPIESSIMQIVTTVTRVESRSTPAADFEVPAGFKRVDPPAMGVE